MFAAKGKLATRATLRQHVAVVLQDTFLFNASVRENLCYGKPDATSSVDAEAEYLIQQALDEVMKGRTVPTCMALAARDERSFAKPWRRSATT